MDGLGRLYSKQNIIEALLEQNIPSNFSHIKSLKDIKDLNLTPNPAFKDDSDNSTAHDNAPFICALIGLEMSGKFRFVALWTCGCVFSERALKELKSNNCSICQKPFTEQDVVVLNGSDEDVDLMRTRMDARVARLKAEKKAKADKKNKIKVEVKQEGEVTVKEEKPLLKLGQPGSSKQGKLNMAPPILTLKAEKREIVSDKLAADPRAKKVKSDYSVQKDNGASEVFKSIFTSHQSDKEQPRAHWITYNPFYN